MEAHHLRPFHLWPELELDEGNLLALCEGNHDINCHLVIGHDFDFRGYNPDAVIDAARLLKEKEDNKLRIK